MYRRQGTTLIEVLVAIFVMAIGMIALLTLFPLGAIRMAQAIQDNYCATAVVNANAVATLWDIRNDPSVSYPQGPGKFNSFTDVDTPNGRKPADPNGPSYPVFVDPIGIYYYGDIWVCLNTPYKGLIRRVPVSFAPPNPLPPPPFNPITPIYKWFCLMDDYIFENNETKGGGTPYNYVPGINPPIIKREIHYSWAYLLQRPRSSDSSIVSCSVVVYKNRPLTQTSKLSFMELAYTVSNFNMNTNTISVTWTSGSAPNVNPGDWVLDCTYVPGPTTYGSAHGMFYRVVSITPTGLKSVDFEVQQKIRGFNPANATNPGTIMILEGVVDVYERGLDRKFD